MERAKTPAESVQAVVTAYRAGGELRGVVINEVGFYLGGFANGLRAGSDTFGPGAAKCFGGWTAGQSGEWLLQYWEKHPELWDKGWQESAMRLALDRILTPGAC